MFGNNKTNGKPANRIDSLVGAGTRVEGNIQFSGGLRIDGQVHGSVVCTNDQPGMLVISENAEVVGEIRVNHVIVNGKVNGDVHYKRLEIQGGAIVQGMVLCDAVPQSDKVVQLKPATAD